MESIVASVLVFAVTSLNASFGNIRARQVNQVDNREQQEIVANNENIKFVKPVKDNCEPIIISREFREYHNGIDFVSTLPLEERDWKPCKVIAAAAGEVEYAGWSNQGEGYMIIIRHTNNLTTEYFHGDGVFDIKIGDKVIQGQDIMNMGCTGYCTGTHLHFSVKENNIYVDPSKFLD